MDKEQNHYKVLGVGKDADAEEIRHAYRTAARRHHPDLATGDSDSFRRIQEAYEILSDKGQRARYDRKRTESGIHAGVRPSPTYEAGGNEGFHQFTGYRGRMRDRGWPFAGNSIFDRLFEERFSRSAVGSFAEPFATRRGESIVSGEPPFGARELSLIHI